jgi:hypothetical protein
MYETANFATPVVNELIKGKKIVSFDISEDIMTVLLGFLINYIIILKFNLLICIN